MASFFLGERGRLADVMAKVHDPLYSTYKSFMVFEIEKLERKRRIWREQDLNTVV